MAFGFVGSGIDPLPPVQYKLGIRLAMFTPQESSKSNTQNVQSCPLKYSQFFPMPWVSILCATGSSAALFSVFPSRAGRRRGKPGVSSDEEPECKAPLLLLLPYCYLPTGPPNPPSPPSIPSPPSPPSPPPPYCEPPPP